MIWTLLVLGVILIISSIMERIFMEINPWIWRVGGVVGIIFNMLDMGVVSILEGILGAIIFFILIFVAKLNYGIGGGVLKGMIMCAIYLGRYFVITFVISVVLLFVMSKIREHRMKDELPGQSLVMAMPIVIVSVAITILIMYRLGILL